MNAGKTLLGVSAVLLAGAGAVLLSGGAQATPSPTPPPWVQEGGRVDVDKLPANMPVLDANGRVVPGKVHNPRQAVQPPRGGPRVPKPMPGERRVVDPATGAETLLTD